MMYFEVNFCTMKKTAFIVCFLLLGIQPLLAQKGKDTALKSVGAFSAIVLYNTYLAIGSIADAYEYGAYETEYVEELMQEQVATMDNLSETCDELLASGFLTDEADVHFVEEIQYALSLLKEQASALDYYLKADSEEAGSAFQEARSSAWEKISELLGIE